MWLKQHYYDQSEKAGTLLAWRIKKILSEKAITCIVNSTGSLMADPSEINNSFREFYTELYKYTKVLYP